MKPVFFLASLYLMLAAACEKKVVSTTPIPNGTYVGTFIRSSPTTRFAPANVTLTIDGNKFSGVSDKPNYPAICSGTFKTNGVKISVENDCMFTADFDWSLIFKGEYEYKIVNEELKINRTSPNSITDRYTLKKQ